MSKREFLEELRIALAGRVGAGEVTEHLSYYEDYINMQVRMGNREEDVVAGLGEPRLLARNIAESKKYASDGSEKTHHSAGGQYYSEASEQFGRNVNSNGNTYNSNQAAGRTFKMPGWAIAFVVIFVVLLIFGLIFSILSFLAPIFIPVIIILFVIRLLKK